MSSLVVDTNVLARHALGDLETADEIGPAIRRLREERGSQGAPTAPERASLAARMVTS